MDRSAKFEISYIFYDFKNRFPFISPLIDFFKAPRQPKLENDEKYRCDQVSARRGAAPENWTGNRNRKWVDSVTRFQPTISDDLLRHWFHWPSSIWMDFYFHLSTRHYFAQCRRWHGDGMPWRPTRTSERMRWPFFLSKIEPLKAALESALFENWDFFPRKYNCETSETTTKKIKFCRLLTWFLIWNLKNSSQKTSVILFTVVAARRIDHFWNLCTVRCIQTIQ